MSPEEALRLLDELTAQIQLSRADHERVLKALGVLRNVVQLHLDERTSQKEE